MSGRRIAALGLAIALIVGLWLRATAPAAIEDLGPRPDALEYEQAARSLLAGDGYALIVEGARYPPRYPFGLSLLLAPLLWLRDSGPGAGIPIVLLAALATIVATGQLARAAAGPLAGAIAALLIAVSPLHVQWSRAVMSDVPSACAVAWLLVALMAAMARDRDRADQPTEHRSTTRWLAIGAGIGVSTWLRLPNAVVSVSAAIAVWRCGASGRARRLAALAAGLVLGSIPLLAYDAAVFGSPLRSGYGLWANTPYFSPSYALGAPAGGGESANALHYVRALAGLGELYSWPIALLVAVGIVLALRSRGARRDLAWLVLGLTIALLALQVMFFWQATRFLLIALPGLLALAALPLSSAAPVALRAVSAALLLVGLGWLARAPEAHRLEPHVSEAQKLRELDALVPADAAVLMSATEPFVRRYLCHPGSQRVWVPIGYDAHQLFTRLHGIQPLGPASNDDGHWIRQGLSVRSAVAMVRALLAEGRPVFLAYEPPLDVPHLADTIAGAFQVEPIARSEKGDWVVQRLRERAGASVVPLAPTRAGWQGVRVAGVPG